MVCVCMSMQGFFSILYFRVPCTPGKFGEGEIATAEECKVCAAVPGCPAEQVGSVEWCVVCDVWCELDDA